MAKRTPDEVLASLLAAGWPVQPAITMTAISGGESGWDDTSLGDTGLEDASWGPSYGLFQIRTLKADTGSGTNRDIARLSSGDVQQAAAALAIYQGAGGFSPWTQFNNGGYQQYLGQAQAAAARVGSGGGGGGGGDGGGILPNQLPTVGLPWLPWNWPSDAYNFGHNWTQSNVVDPVNQGASNLLTGVRFIAIEALVVVAGLGLIVGGLYLTGAPNPLTGNTGWQRKGRRLVGQVTGLGGGS